LRLRISFAPTLRNLSTLESKWKSFCTMRVSDMNHCFVLNCSENFRSLIFFVFLGIHSTTVQLEFAKPSRANSSSSCEITDSNEESDAQSNCFLSCPFDEENEDCISNRCCGIERHIASASVSTHALSENTHEVEPDSSKTTCFTNIPL